MSATARSFRQGCASHLVPVCISSHFSPAVQGAYGAKSYRTDHSSTRCPSTGKHVRSFWSVSTWSDPVRLNTDMSARLDRFNDTLLSANWGDYFQLVQDVPFWQEEMEHIDSEVISFLHDAVVAKRYGDLCRTMDLLYQVEDIRDHLNEILDYISRSGGVAGTGAYALPPMENPMENVDALTSKYEELKQKYPTHLPQIEQTLGIGLALLRQKMKFHWSTMHQYAF